MLAAIVDCPEMARLRIEWLGPEEAFHPENLLHFSVGFLPYNSNPKSKYQHINYYLDEDVGPLQDGLGHLSLHSGGGGDPTMGAVGGYSRGAAGGRGGGGLSSMAAGGRGVGGGHSAGLGAAGGHRAGLGAAGVNLIKTEQWVAFPDMGLGFK